MSRIEVGEMEELPFADAAFDAVTSFNAFQFAGDPGRALREAGRVCRQGGTIAMLVWGPKDDCDLSGTIVPAVMALLPAAKPAGAPPPPLSHPGTIEIMMERAGLQPSASGDVDSHFTYPDTVTAWRAISSAGGVVRAIRQAGEDAVRRAVENALGSFTGADGSVILRNRFHWVTATAGSAGLS